MVRGIQYLNTVLIMLITANVAKRPKPCFLGIIHRPVFSVVDFVNDSPQLLWVIRIRLQCSLFFHLLEMLLAFFRRSIYYLFLQAQDASL